MSSNAKEKRTHLVNIALTKNERKLFGDEALKRGTTISGLLREATLKTIQQEKQIFQSS